jgi:hypothetical protein
MKTKIRKNIGLVKPLKNAHHLDNFPQGTEDFGCYAIPSAHWQINNHK